jgi:hypothetical protein
MGPRGNKKLRLDLFCRCVGISPELVALLYFVAARAFRFISFYFFPKPDRYRDKTTDTTCKKAESKGNGRKAVSA